MFLYEKTHRYLKNDYQFFDTLKTKDPKIRGNYNLLIKVRFFELKWSSRLSIEFSQAQNHGITGQNIDTEYLQEMKECKNKILLIIKT